MTVRRSIGQVICLVLLALAVGACRRTPTPIPTPTDTPLPATDTPTPVTDTPTPVVDTPTPTPGRAADLLAGRYLVECRHLGEAGREVPVGQHEPVGTGDEINTDQTGLGILTFADFLRVEVFRETGLQVKAAPDPDAPPIVKLYLALGTTLQELQKRAGERVVVTTETDWATITSVATTYLISVDKDGVTSVVVYEGEAKVEAQQRTVTVRPGQATLVEPRKAPRSPSDVEMGAVDDWVSAVRKPEEVGSIKPVIFPSADALTPTSTPTPTRTPIPTSTATSTLRPADVRLISDLQISNLSPLVGESVKATFEVRNYGEQTFTARYFGVKGRGPDNSIRDFLMLENLSLASGAEYTYSSDRSFSAPGQYWFTPHYSLDGSKWLDITWPDDQVSYVYSTVQDNPPVVEKIYVEPATIYQGEEFRIKLIASDDVGLQTIRWRIEGTGDKYFDKGDEAGCDGITQCELSWDLKWAGKDGQFTIYAQARDTADQLSSIGSTPITVLGLADVTVQSIDRIDVNCVTGSCTTTVVFTIANVGQASAAPFKVLIKADPTLGQIKAIGVNGLAAGATMTLKESLPSDGNCYDPNCTVCITVNSGGYVVESNEGNNELCEAWIG
ncbi:MAG: CARDB domain-containing protein [Anaerolineae bacterium]